MENNNFLREELKDETLEAVAGGKKFKEKDWQEAEKKRKEAEERAKKMMQNSNNRSF
jgi:hypothetical protein